ncbi:MAG: hypothetical protein JF593_04080 [Novosphingobium sp.]|nr:hypothetical protein [Novosphingobium sp.]
MPSHILAALAAASLTTAGVAGTAAETRAAAALPVAVAAVAPAANASAQCRTHAGVATSAGKLASCDTAKLAAPPEDGNGVGAGAGHHGQALLTVFGAALGLGGLAIALSSHNKSGG